MALKDWFSLEFSGDLVITVDGEETKMLVCNICHTVLPEVRREGHRDWHKTLDESIRRAEHALPPRYA